MTPTFDDLRTRPQPCPCGRHQVTGHRQPLIVCPWQPALRPGVYGAPSEPEIREGCE